MLLSIHQLQGKKMKPYFLFLRIKIKYLIYISIIFVFICPSLRISYANQEKKKVLSFLEGRHWSLKSEEFLLMGKDTDSVLIDIARDTRMINYLRFRAMEALSLFPTEKTAKFLELTSKRSFAALARRSFEAFRNGFSKTQPTRVKKLASILLRHSNASLRIDAARVMRSMDKNRFEVFLKSETSTWVRIEAKN